MNLVNPCVGDVWETPQGDKFTVTGNPNGLLIEVDFEDGGPGLIPGVRLCGQWPEEWRLKKGGQS